MRYWKMRLFGLALIAVFAALVYYEWQKLRQEGRYSIRLATFAPLAIVGGIFILLFPSKAGKPQTTGERIITLLVFALGLLAGLVNWYLMDPGFFLFQ